MDRYELTISYLHIDAYVFIRHPFGASFDMEN